MSRIHTIDTHYLGQPRFAAVYLMIENDRAAFIDNNTNAALPALRSALAANGLDPAQVEFIIVTHVHLDHAGATAALARACPNATVVAHPRAAPHIIDPAKLVSSAEAVYGEETFRRHYGEIEALPAQRVRVMEDEQALTFGARELRFLHTRGHANHHFCIDDPATGGMFTGDAFGLIYPALQSRGTFALPSTSPTDFDPVLAREAVRRIMDAAPTCVYPTHFGAVYDVAGAGRLLLRHLDFAEALLHEAVDAALPDEALAAWLEPRIRDYLTGVLDGHGDLAGRAATWQLLALDINLNAQGIAFAAAKRRRKAREGAD